PSIGRAVVRWRSAHHRMDETHLCRFDQERSESAETITCRAEMDISIVIPCLNEEQNLAQLVRDLRDTLSRVTPHYEILIVDDGSDDYTVKEALRLETQHSGEVRALHRGLPRGIGNAIRFGLDHAVGTMGVVVMGDGVDPLDLIPVFWEKVNREQ